MRGLCLVWLAACAGAPDPAHSGGGTQDVREETGDPDDGADDATDTDTDTDAGTDTDSDTDTDAGTDGEPDTDDDGLIGILLDPPLDPPEFDVLAADGTPRTPDWFTGDPSVVWFFRDTGAT